MDNIVSNYKYGLVNFECGTKTNVGNNVGTYCNNFKGMGVNAGEGGVISMRHVYFQEGFSS